MENANEKEILGFSSEEKLRLINAIILKYGYIEQLKDNSEIYSTIRWIATNGKQGENFGHGWVYREMEW